MLYNLARQALSSAKQLQLPRPALTAPRWLPGQSQLSSHILHQRLYSSMTPKLDAADVAETVTERQKIVLDEKDLIETFIRGSGNGGQKINKTSICVDLRHIPTGIRITCHDTRSLQANRAIARKRLKDKLDQMVNGDQSKAAQKIQKIQQQKNTQRKRALKKYGDMSQGGVERYKKNRPSEQQQEQQQEQ